MRLRPSQLIRRRIAWVPYTDRPGLRPVGPYDLWARVLNAECEVAWFWRWRVVAPLRAVLGLPHRSHGPWGWE